MRKSPYYTSVRKKGLYKIMGLRAEVSCRQESVSDFRMGELMDPGSPWDRGNRKVWLSRKQ